MFFGVKVTTSNPFKYQPQQVTAEMGDVLSISNLVLDPDSHSVITLQQQIIWTIKQNSVQLILKRLGSQQSVIAKLTKANPHVYINLMLWMKDNVQLSVQGDGIVHVAGFYQREFLTVP